MQVFLDDLFDAEELLAIYSQSFGAGWSSLVARRAHNPKVVSSNLAPATNLRKAPHEGAFCYDRRNSVIVSSRSMTGCFRRYHRFYRGFSGVVPG